MDNFSIIYKILEALEKAMDYDVFDTRLISHEKFGITYHRWVKIIIMMVNSGYIDNVPLTHSLIDDYPRIDAVIHPVITLKGLEYLVENEHMRKDEVKTADRAIV